MFYLFGIRNRKYIKLINSESIKEIGFIIKLPIIKKKSSFKNVLKNVKKY